VAPSLPIEDRRCHVKQYFQEERALRTETPFHDTYDLGVGRGLKNFGSLRTLGQRINGQEAERVAHSAGWRPPTWQGWWSGHGPPRATPRRR